MADEILREIAAMEGIKLDSTDEETPVDEEIQDEQDEEGEGERKESSAEGEDAEGVLDEEEESLEERYKRLLEYTNELSAKLQEQPPAVTTPAPAPIASPAPVITPKQRASDFTFDEALLEKAQLEDDPKALKEILLSVMQQLRNETATLKEEVLLELPRIAQSVTQSQLQVMKAVDKFYQDSPDLLPHAQTVGHMANKIAAADPNLPMPEIFQRAETETRKLLGLRKRVQKVDAADAKKPAFATPKGARKPVAPKLSGVRSEIAAMQSAK